MGEKLCGAKTRAGTPCRRPAGWGTDHPGKGRCKLHGGASHGAPKGSKNALKTGEHEAIWLDTLTDEEKDLYSQVNTENTKQLDEEIRLLSIRERRMLERIKKVLKGWEQDDIETTYVDKPKKISVPAFGQDGTLQINDKLLHEMIESERVEKKRAKLERILAIEEALTRVQRQKSKLIELKHRIESDQSGDDDGSLAQLAEVIRKSTEALARPDPGDEE